MPVKIEKDNSITISGFEGIGQSVLSDFSDMMGINNDIKGVASSNYSFNIARQEQASTTVTFNATTSVITMATGIPSYRGIAAGRAVKFSTDGSLPIGLTAGTIYYISVIDQGLQTFKVYDTLKGALEGTAFTALGGTGSGTHTMEFVEPSAIKYWTKNNTGKYYALDDNGRLWFCGASGGAIDSPYLIAGNTTSQPNGLVYYKGYILVFSASRIDALKDISSATTTLEWEPNFQTVTMSTGQNANVFLSVSDDAVYFYNGSVGGSYHRIGLLEEKALQTFDPGNTATFSMVADVTTIPFDSYNDVSAINEINQNLLIASNSGKIYFWDKKSPSFTSHIELPEKSIDTVSVSNNFAYVFAGNIGSIYIVSTSASDIFYKIPTHLTKDSYQDGVDNVVIHYSAIVGNKLLFSASIITSTPYPNSTVNSFIGSLDLKTKNFTKFGVSSFGQLLDRNGGVLSKINSILPVGGNLIISSSIYDIETDTTAHYLESNLVKYSYYSGKTFYAYHGDYTPYIITGLITYGDVYNKKTIKTLSVSFLRELTTGQGVKVYYRRNDNSAWTLLKTVDFTTYGTIKDIKVESPLTDIIDLQIKIELSGYKLITGTTSATSTTPYLKSIRLIP